VDKPPGEQRFGLGVDGHARGMYGRVRGP
jgi:hypothetical protein